MEVDYGSHIFHITSIDNLPSISQTGLLLCKNNLARNAAKPVDISHAGIQSARSNRLVICPTWGTLHHYVPFHFVPRSPMLCAVHYNKVNHFSGTQKDIVHLVATVQAVQEANRRFVFTDGHPTVSQQKCNFYTKTEDLDKINWDAMRAKYWKDCQNAREAEFLVFLRLPWEYISAIAVYDQSTKEKTEEALAGAAHAPPIIIEPS